MMAHTTCGGRVRAFQHKLLLSKEYLQHSHGLEWTSDFYIYGHLELLDFSSRTQPDDCNATIFNFGEVERATRNTKLNDKLVHSHAVPPWACRRLNSNASHSWRGGVWASWNALTLPPAVGRRCAIMIGHSVFNCDHNTAVIMWFIGCSTAVSSNQATGGTKWLTLRPAVEYSRVNAHCCSTYPPTPANAGP